MKCTLDRLRRSFEHVNFALACLQVGKPGCRRESHACQRGFPQAEQPSHAPVFDPVRQCYMYYCPGYQHRNVVPYVPVRMTVHEEIGIISCGPGSCTVGSRWQYSWYQCMF